jgi:hypothetical protein
MFRSVVWRHSLLCRILVVVCAADPLFSSLAAAQDGSPRRVLSTPERDQLVAAAQSLSERLPNDAPMSLMRARVQEIFARSILPNSAGIRAILLTRNLTATDARDALALIRRLRADYRREVMATLRASNLPASAIALIADQTRPEYLDRLELLVMQRSVAAANRDVDQVLARAYRSIAAEVLVPGRKVPTNLAPLLRTVTSSPNTGRATAPIRDAGGLAPFLRTVNSSPNFDAVAAPLRQAGGLSAASETQIVQDAVRSLESALQPLLREEALNKIRSLGEEAKTQVLVGVSAALVSGAGAVSAKLGVDRALQAAEALGDLRQRWEQTTRDLSAGAATISRVLPELETIAKATITNGLEAPVQEFSSRAARTLADTAAPWKRLLLDGDLSSPTVDAVLRNFQGPAADKAHSLVAGVRQLASAETGYLDKTVIGLTTLGKVANIDVGPALAAVSQVQQIAQAAGPLLALAGVASLGPLAVFAGPVGGLLGGGGGGVASLFGGGGNDGQISEQLAAISRQLAELMREVRELHETVVRQHIEEMKALDSIAVEVQLTRAFLVNEVRERVFTPCENFIDIDQQFGEQTLAQHFRECRNGLDRTFAGQPANILLATSYITGEGIQQQVTTKLERIAKVLQASSPDSPPCAALFAGISNVAALDSLARSAETSRCAEAYDIGKLLEAGTIAYAAELEQKLLLAVVARGMSRAAASTQPNEWIWNRNTAIDRQTYWGFELRSLNNAIAQQSLLSGYALVDQMIKDINPGAKNEKLSPNEQRRVDSARALMATHGEIAENVLRRWLGQFMASSRSRRVRYAFAYESCSADYFERLIRRTPQETTLTPTPLWQWTSWQSADPNDDQKRLWQIAVDDSSANAQPTDWTETKGVLDPSSAVDVCKTNEAAVDRTRWCARFSTVDACIPMPTPQDVLSTDVLFKRNDVLSGLVHARRTLIDQIASSRVLSNVRGLDRLLLLRLVSMEALNTAPAGTPRAAASGAAQ